MKVVHDGAEVGEKEFKGATTFCLVVAVKQHSGFTSLSTSPLGPAWGPDDIHVYLSSASTQLTVAPLRTHLSLSDTVIYASPVILLHSGTYSLKAEINYRDWRWVRDARIDHYREEVVRLVGTEKIVMHEGGRRTPELPWCYHEKTEGGGESWKVDPSIGRWRKPLSEDEWGWGMEDLFGFVFTPIFIQVQLLLHFTAGWQKNELGTPWSQFLWPPSTTPSIASARPPPEFPAPDFAGVSFVTHDANLGGDPLSFEKDIEVLVGSVLKAYWEEGVPVVVMLAPLVCSSEVGSAHRLWSAARTAYFNHVAKSTFLRLAAASSEQAGLHFWDYSHLAGTTRPDILKYRLCWTGHPDWEKVNVANQFFFNMLLSEGW
ncbi:putative homocysteine S-methyltransferase [Pseudohyphozyma bogoriensis]|nr:putative homocysteine S-methyltransferase [Pseudohyphozyma bogoriensis]